MIRVLIVDDSETSRLALRYIINSAEDMEVVAEAKSGEQGIKLAQEMRPDIILMDMIMPGMDGLEATGEIMHRSPTPIIVISGSIEGHETEFAFQAMRQGALTVLQKPSGPNSPHYEEESRRILRTLRTMSAVRVIHHKKTFRPVPEKKREHVPATTKSPELVAIVSSTGGPGALSEIFSNLPANYPLPIVVVQHITAEFLPSMIKWLNSITPLEVSVAQEKDKPRSGHIYFAPGKAHLRFNKSGRFEYDTTTKSIITPSGDVFLESVAAYYGAKATGVILTGMGSDGTTGLAQMFDRGSMTIAQDQASSIVFGMPQAAIARGVVRSVLPLTEIAAALGDLLKKENQS